MGQYTTQYAPICTLQGHLKLILLILLALYEVTRRYRLIVWCFPGAPLYYSTNP